MDNDNFLKQLLRFSRAQTLLDPAADPTRSKTHFIGGFHCNEIEVFNVKTV